jgi:NADH-quinone oxidoreductase subunit A
MLMNFMTVYVLALMAMGFAAVTLILSQILRPAVPDSLKGTTYECGIEAVGTTEIKHNIRFYIYALLFVIFDVEALYVIPWAVGARRLGSTALVEMVVFLVMLFAGLIFAWGKGALTWE